jgi:hypothetical protein
VSASARKPKIARRGARGHGTNGGSLTRGAREHLTRSEKGWAQLLGLAGLVGTRITRGAHSARRSNESNTLYEYATRLRR